VNIGPFHIYLGFSLNEREYEYKLLLGLIFIQGFSWFLVFPILPLYAQHLGADPALIGLVMSAPSLFQIVLCIPGGILASRLGKRWIFRWALLLGVVAAVIYYFAPHVAWLFLAQFMFGTSHGLFWPSQGAYLADLATPEERSSLLGFTFGLSAISFLAGPPLAGFLMDSVRPNTVFLVYLAMALLGLVLAQRLPTAAEQGGALDSSGLGSLANESIAAIRELLSIPTMQFAVAGTLLMYLCWGVFDAFFPLHLQEVGLSATVLGLLLMVRGIVMGLLRFGGGAFAAKLGVSALLIIGLVASGLSLIALAFANALTPIIAVAVLAGFGPGLIPVATTTLIAGVLEEQQRPIGMGINELGVGVGRLTGSTTFGYVTQAAGLAVSFISAGALVVFGALILISRVGVVRRQGETVNAQHGHHV
jgi:predicted MFS family arabinose efflux permease